MEQNIFSSGIFQNYLALYVLNILGALLGLICGNLMECQDKTLKIQLNQTAISHQIL